MSQGGEVVTRRLHRAETEGANPSPATTSKQADYQRAHYLKNKAQYVERSRLNKIKMKALQRAFIAEYKQKNPCVDCGEDDPVVLDLDHRDRSTKRFNIADCTSKASYGMESLIAEIAKCDVRCANCHRRKTSRERLKP